MNEIFEFWKRHPRPWIYDQGCVNDKMGNPIDTRELTEYIELIEFQLTKVIEQGE